MSEKFGDFLFSHLPRVPFAVVDDEALNPVDESLLGSDTVMFAADYVRTCSSSFGLPACGILTTLSAMRAILSSQIPNPSRIRPKIWVFLLKCPKIGSNSR